MKKNIEQIFEDKKKKKLSIPMYDNDGGLDGGMGENKLKLSDKEINEAVNIAFNNVLQKYKVNEYTNKFMGKLTENKSYEILCKQLINAVEDDFPSEPDENGISMNPIKEVLYNNEFKLTPQLVQRLISYLVEYDFFYVDESGKIHIDGANNPKAAQVLTKMKNLTNSHTFG